MYGMRENIGTSEQAGMDQTQNQEVCPRCQSEHVVRNGRPRGRQRFLCRGCGKKWREGAVGGRHYSPEIIGPAVQMVYSGRSFSKTAARLKEMWSTEDEEIGISLQTVRHWVLRYSVAAMASLQETKVPSSGRWSLWGIKGSYFESAWFMMDKDTGYIISYQIPPIRNDGSPRAVVRKALASSASPPVSVAYYGVWTTGGRLSGLSVMTGPALVLGHQQRN